jgi:hypothetical protein
VQELESYCSVEHVAKLQEMIDVLVVECAELQYGARIDKSAAGVSIQQKEQETTTREERGMRETTVAVGKISSKSIKPEYSCGPSQEWGPVPKAAHRR